MTTSKQNKFLIFKALVILGIGSMIVLNALNPFRVDVSILLVAAEHHFANLPVYFMNSLDGLPEHTKPPLASLLIAPFTHWPREVVYRALDFTNVAVFLILIRHFCRQITSESGTPRTSLTIWWVLLAIMPLWGREIRFGQFNALTFAFMVMAPRIPPALGGLGIVSAILLKPSNIILLPWTLFQSREKIRLGLWTGLVGAFLAASFILLFGWERFLGEHLAWRALMTSRIPIYSSWTDSLGWPGILYRHGVDFGGGNEILIWVGGLASVLTVARIRSPMISLGIVAILSVLFSPAAWLHNYCLMLPALVVFIHGLETLPGPWRRNPAKIASFAGAFIFLLAFTLLSGPAFLPGETYLHARYTLALPFVAANVAILALAILGRRRPWVN